MKELKETDIIELYHKTIPNENGFKHLIEFLVITERQYANIRFITGKEKSKIISSDERLVIL